MRFLVTATRLTGIVVLSLLLIASLVSSGKVAIFALDPVEELQQQIGELEKLKNLSEAATTPLEKEVANLESRINSARKGIEAAKTEVVQVGKDIEEREVDLALQYKILSKRINGQYKRLRVVQSQWLLFSTSTVGNLTKDLAYRESVQAQDQRLINAITGDIADLEKDRQALEERQKTLAQLEKQLDAQAVFFKTEIAKAKDYQKTLSSKIADLSARQQSIINARSGSFTTSVGEVPLADDFNASIGFKAQAPNNSFAVFSFGGYTHRNGMSQYGAKARAESGQSAEEILKAYYPNATLKKDYSAMSSISVQGVGTIPFEDQYLQGIFEVPSSWHIEALKAQAIAARTYAIKYTNNGSKTICITEACQVFKNQRKGGEWERAVNETRGWVLVDGGGSPVSTQYASTHGGYSNTSGWDTTDKSGEGSWSTRAWENTAKSPWFYKAWYRSGYFSSGDGCGRSHPWLSQEEFSDIINAWIVRTNPNGADTGRIQPVTINQCQIGGGGNPYSMSELRELANKSGGAVTQVTSVSVSHNNSGQTTTVTVGTNRGNLSIPGSEFKSTFNLRAPGYLRIPQSSFGFFNIEFKQ